MEPGRDAVAVHDAVLDLSVDAGVGVMGLDLQDEGARWLVLQDHGGPAVVLTLKEESQSLQEPAARGRTQHPFTVFPATLSWLSVNYLSEFEVVLLSKTHDGEIIKSKTVKLINTVGHNSKVVSG